MLVEYLEAGAGLRRLRGPNPPVLLRRALERAAGCEGLDPAWGPSPDDPGVIERLRQTAEDWSGKGPIPSQQVLVAWLQAEVADAFSRLLEAARNGASDAPSVLLRASLPDITIYARSIAGASAWMLSDGRSGPISEVLRDRIQGFCLYLLQEDAAVVRRCQGGSRDQWRAYLAVTFRRFVVAEGRRSSAVRRGGRASTISTGSEAGLAALKAVALGSRPVDRVIARLDLRPFAEDLRAFAARGEQQARDVGIFLRAGSGESHREIALDNEDGLGRADVRSAIRRVRAYLRPRLEEMREGGKR